MRTYFAGGTITAYTIAKFSDDDTVVAAAAATDAFIGVTDNLGVISGERVDIHIDDSIPVLLKFGGTVARGAAITSDASGFGVAAAPSAGSNVRIIGFALESAASGDVRPIKYALGVMQG